jgi:hypothetical protein
MVEPCPHLAHGSAKLSTMAAYLNNVHAFLPAERVHPISGLCRVEKPVVH